MPAAVKPSPGRITIFEGLRAYLAWWVVGYHILSECGFESRFLPGILRVVGAAGGEAVRVFIILSGFVITHLLLNKKESYRLFLTRRFFRLYPAFIGAVILGAALLPWIVDLYTYLKANPLATTPRLEDWWMNGADHFWRYLPASVTMLHGAMPNALLPHAQAAFISPGWSISLEWQFYLVVPFVLRLASKWPFYTMAGIALVVATSDYWPVGEWGSFLPQRAEYFLLGCVSYLVYRRLPSVRWSGPLPLIVWTALIWITLSPEWRKMLAGSYEFSIGPWLPVGIWSLALSLAVDHRTSPENPRMRGCYWLFNNPVIQALGKISFSTYLYHYFAIFAGLALFRALGLPANKYYALAVVAPVTLLLTIAISFLVYHAVEKPGIAWGSHYCRRLQLRLKTPPAVAGLVLKENARS